ncbi:ATP-dependent helicase [Bradyrhizobium sp. WYCCWR 13023]|uniref:DNA 3'-5' helicase n=1 Tax=Bradyrhizobium zhengyangense TaxID=2911009 RepID=A0A9X1UF32_9BRAD|nr:ATP-dependent helicase [Bradyrhizobium zhengyangense]MCG2633074.1 ATP-dependent helicase [Bradyrhizobium zhengyangense]
MHAVRSQLTSILQSESKEAAMQHQNSSALKELNPRQRKAVTYGMEAGTVTQHRPLLIIAGAGTGKTETLAMRTGRLLACGAKPSAILVASFTKRASKELVERAQRAITSTTGNTPMRLPYAGTFHSIAYSLLNEFRTQVDLAERFTALDGGDAVDLMDLVRTRSGAVDKEGAFPSAAICTEIHSYSRNACLSLKATLQRNRYRRWQKHAKALTNIFASYTKAKRSQNVIDYDDMLVLLAELLQHPVVGPRLRQRFKFVLIDEFQDTNKLQFKIVTLLKPTGHGVTVVGDDAQAIYSFRAATVKNIRKFPQSFESSAKIISLTRNYRSTEPILRASNALMASAADAFQKKLWSKRKSGQLPMLTTVKDEIDQADHVVRTVIELQEQGIPLAQQAILFRASQQSLSLELALSRARIPFRKWGGTKLLESAHIKDVMAVLKWWQNPADQIAGIRVMSLLPGIGKATADQLVQELATRRFLPWLARASVPPATTDQWATMTKMYWKVGKSEWPASLERIARWYRPHLERLHDNFESRQVDIDQLVALGGTFPTCHEFLAELALDPPSALADQKVSKENADDVLTLSTIHSAKGSEWKCVTVISAMEGCIPSSKCANEDEIEEERRLFYVAMTRARDRLEIFLPRRYFQVRGQSIPAANVYCRPSRFILPGLANFFEQVTRSTSRTVVSSPTYNKE